MEDVNIIWTERDKIMKLTEWNFVGGGVEIV
jgi:hypothetical protein